MSSFGLRSWGCVLLGLMVPLVAAATGALPRPPSKGAPRRPGAMSFTPAPVWIATLPGQIPEYYDFPPVIRGDPLVFSAPPFLSGLNASTGVILYNAPIASGTEVGGDGRTVVVTGGSPSFQAFTRNTGKLLWNSSACSDPNAHDQFGVTSQVLYCIAYGANKNESAGLNLTTGAVKWVGNSTVNNFITCGPKVGGLSQWACVVVRLTAWDGTFSGMNITVVNIDTGMARWAYTHMTTTDYPYIAATETTFGVFFEAFWVIFDVTTGKVKANVTMNRPFIPMSENFGLYCGTSPNMSARVVCMDELGRLVLNKTYPYSATSLIPDRGHLVTKNLLLVQSYNFSTDCVDAIEVGTNRVVWSLFFPRDPPTVTFFPASSANFFSVRNPMGITLFHARTGTMIAQIAQLGVVGVFLSDKSLGRIFTATPSTITSYRLQ